jgi:Holliday junction resolvase-like predicted endonuclease
MAFERIKNRETHRLGFGLEIEERACEWLRLQSSWMLIARNFRSRGGEVDLIFEQLRPVTLPGGGLQNRIELVFVEVRAREIGGMVSGFESVGPAKQRHLALAARAFLSRYRGRAQAVRFDVVDWDGFQFRRMENAFSIPE